VQSPFKADMARYSTGAWLREQSVWAIAVYRFGRWSDRRKFRLVRWCFHRIYWVTYRVVETLTGITMPKMAEIGPGFRIHHFGGIVIHQNAKIGANCTIRHGVTIGDRYHRGPVPVVEDDVEFGACSQALGGIRIGKGAKIGAMSLVLCDVPPGATAVGIPARIILEPHSADAIEPESDKLRDQGNTNKDLSV